MTAGTSALAADLETYIRQTQESRGQQITVLKQVRCLLRMLEQGAQLRPWCKAGVGAAAGRSREVAGGHEAW